MDELSEKLFNYENANKDVQRKMLQSDSEFDK